MTKIEIDNKKLWESLIQLMSGGDSFMAVEDVTLALRHQGLCYKDGEITTIEPEVKWYVAIDNYGIYKSTMSQVPIFCKGEMTTKEKVYTYFPNMTDEEFNKHFRPATKEDIQKYALENPLVGEFDFPDYDKPATEEETTRKTLVEVYQASVDSATKKPEQPKKCLFTKDHYTDEERKELCEGCQEECELNKDIEPEKRKVSSVLKKMLDNLDEESLAKTREEMQKTPEIAEFDKSIETLIGEIDGDYCVYISSYDDYINKFAPKILAAARKLIASEVKSKVDTMLADYQAEVGISNYVLIFKKGIEATIKKIKGESV